MDSSVKIFLIFSVLCGGVMADTCILKPDSLGTSFVFAMQDVFWTDEFAPRDPEIYITTLANDPVTVTVSAPLDPGTLWLQREVYRGNIETVQIPESLRATGSDISDKGILVEATDEVSIQFINQENWTSDGQSLYPNSVLGNVHYAVTWANHILQIVATEPGLTAVSITLTDETEFDGVSYFPGDTINFNLNQYQVASLQDYFNITSFETGIDISGSKIVTDQAVAVFGGSHLGFVPVMGNGAADHLLEQMLPYELWGCTFVLVSTPARSIGDVFRVSAANDLTELTLSCSAGTDVINDMEYIDYDIASGDYCLLTATQPVQVYLFAKGMTNPPDIGDPAQTLIPPIEQYDNKFLYSTMEGTVEPFTFYAAIVFPTDKLNGLLWNGEELADKLGATFTHIHPAWGWGLTAGLFEVTAGVQDVYHTDPTVNFMIYVSGLQLWYSYGTTAGSRAVPISGCAGSTMVTGDGVDNDCDALVDEELENGIDDDGDGSIDEDVALARVNGEWSDWSAWSCDCPLGQEERNRTCDNPAPCNGGIWCVGVDTEEGVCICTTTTSTTTTTTTSTTATVPTTSSATTPSPTTTTTTTPTTTPTSSTTIPTTTSRIPTTTNTIPTTTATIPTTTATIPTTTATIPTTTATIPTTPDTSPTTTMTTLSGQTTNTAIPTESSVSSTTTSPPATTPITTTAYYDSDDDDDKEGDDGEFAFPIIIGIAIGAAVLVCCTPFLVAGLIRRSKGKQNKVEDILVDS